MSGDVALEHDSEGMLPATLALPDHIELALTSELPDLELREPRAVVVFGMGGSGVAGSVLEALARPVSGVPVVALGAGEGCPAFVGPGSLAVAVSFSGETEETLEAAERALSSGATVVALTRGGTLARLVVAGGGSVLEVRGEIPEPRAGIGAMTAPLLLLSERFGLVPGARAALENAVGQLRVRAASFANAGGVAGELARRIGRTIPLAHGAAGLGAVAARRFKTQVNENAKAPAFSAAQPEVCHNEVCGFGQAGDVTRQLLTVVEFRIGSGPLDRRFDLVAELIEEAVADVVTLEGEGEGELARFFDLVLTGDVASLHLAAGEGVDPGPVPVIDELKRRLAARAG